MASVLPYVKVNRKQLRGISWMPEHDDEDKFLAEQIKHYLESHPDAADSPEGIAMWWIPRQRHKESVKKVSKVLKYLAEEGIVQKKELNDGSFLYAGIKNKLTND